jgi:hypothetical protein
MTKGNGCSALRLKSPLVSEVVLSSHLFSPLMNAPNRNDILASNLLYAVVGVSLLYQVAGWVFQALAPLHNLFSPIHFSVLTLGALSLTCLIRIGLAYAVRRGALAAKILLALGFIFSLYTQGVVAMVSFAHFTAGSLVLLLTDLLTLAALVLMFKKPRSTPSSSLYI